MHHLIRMAMILAVVADAGCALEKEFVGATLAGQDSEPGSDDGASEPTTHAGDGDATHTSQAETDTQGARAYGEPCTFEQDGAPFVPHSKLAQATDECAGGACVFADNPQSAACDGPEDCAGVASQTGACSPSGVCTLDLEWVASRSLCSQTCEADADCPATAACAGGSSCHVVQQLAPFCCEKLCVCNDDIDQGSAQTLDQQCADLGGAC